MLDTINLLIKQDTKLGKKLTPVVLSIKNGKTISMASQYVKSLNQQIAEKSKLLNELYKKASINHKINTGSDWDGVFENLSINEYEYTSLVNLENSVKTINEEMLYITSPENNVNYQKAFFNHAKQKGWVVGENREISIPSSDSKVQIYINPLKEEIKIRFSIPKYLYGTNLFEFLPTFGTPLYSVEHNYYKDLQKISDITYTRMIRLLKDFFITNFVSINFNEVGFSDVIIDEIHFCTNQYFNDSYIIDEVMEMQRKKKKKYERTETMRKWDYKTTPVYIVSQASTFKIYRKYQDFLKHDYKNLQKSSRGYDVEHLKEKSKHILRYETEMRNAKINEIFTNKLLKDSNYVGKVYNEAQDYNDYKKIRSVMRWTDVTNRNDDVNFEIGKRIEDIKPTLLYLFDIKRLKIETFSNGNEKPYLYTQLDLKEEYKRFFKKYEKYLNTRSHFTLSLEYKDLQTRDMQDRYKKEKQYLFEKRLFYELAKYHFQNCEQFQIKKRDTFSYYENQLVEHNERVIYENEINKHIKGYRRQQKINDDILHVIQIINKKDFDWYCTKFKLNTPKKRSVKQRLKVRLEKIGFNTTHSTTDAISNTASFIMPKLSVKKYYSFMCSNTEKTSDNFSKVWRHKIDGVRNKKINEKLYTKKFAINNI